MSKLTTAEKALEIARTAKWIADLNVNVPADWAKRVDRAHEALRILPESFARNQICGLLASVTTLELATDPIESVRLFIAATQSGHEFRVNATPSSPTDATILRAIEAWGRGRGVPASGRDLTDKWTATAELLREAGFSPATPESLRKAWDRRSK